MEKDRQRAIVLDIFANISSHRFASEVIRRHSSNPRDIREEALGAFDLSRCRSILDIGCGFGFFTEALKGRVHPEAAVTGIDVIPEYKEPFLETCRRSGLKGSFFSEGVEPLRTFPSRSFDLILSSYSLYFFPEVIPEISRILRQSGRFIAITHDKENMTELIAVIKDILREKAILRESRLPIEAIVGQFSAENGMELLSPWFRKIDRIDYRNTLTFPAENLAALIGYFRFKSAFFLSRTYLDGKGVAELLKNRLQSILEHKGVFMLSKDDTIFACTEPAGRT